MYFHNFAKYLLLTFRYFLYNCYLTLCQSCNLPAILVHSIGVSTNGVILGLFFLAFYNLGAEFPHTHMTGLIMGCPITVSELRPQN